MSNPFKKDFIEARINAKISPEKLLVEIAPDIHTKGADYTIETLPEAKAIMEAGGRIEFIDFVEGKSTTNTIKKING